MEPRKRIAVYAGTFDPMTIGHRWMMREGSEIFDELIVAIGDNPDKTPMFSVEERMEVIKEVAEGCELSNVRVDSFQSRYLVQYAIDQRAYYILRGIRSVKDYEFEKSMRHVNFDINAAVSTVFLMPPRSVSEVSSSLVKGLIGPRGWQDVISQYVPYQVMDMILKKVE